MPADREPRNAAGATDGGLPAAETGEPVELADKVEELEAKLERMAARQRALMQALARSHGYLLRELELMP